MNTFITRTLRIQTEGLNEAIAALTAARSVLAAAVAEAVAEGTDTPATWAPLHGLNALLHDLQDVACDAGLFAGA